MSAEADSTDTYLANQLTEFRWKAIGALGLPVTTPLPDLLNLIISKLNQSQTETPRAYAN